MGERSEIRENQIAINLNKSKKTQKRLKKDHSAKSTKKKYKERNIKKTIKLRKKIRRYMKTE